VKEVPAKIEHNGSWVTTKVGLGEDRIALRDPINREITLKSIVNIEEKKNVLSIEVSGPEAQTFRIASVPKVLVALKRLIIMSCSAYRLMAYFMSPAIRGGVLVQNSPWEKGAIAVLKTGIWCVSQQKQICIPLMDVSGIEQTSRDVNEKPMEVVKIDHVEHGEVVTSFVLCPPTTLQVLFTFLRDATKEMDMSGDEIDSIGAQVAMLVYSGMDSTAIEKMLAITPDDLEKSYDALLKLGIIEVVRVRRDVQLTTKGARYVTDAVKPPGQ
jgi:helix-turn-helix protein